MVYYVISLSRVNENKGIYEGRYEKYEDADAFVRKRLEGAIKPHNVECQPSKDYLILDAQICAQMGYKLQYHESHYQNGIEGLAHNK